MSILSDLHSGKNSKLPYMVRGFVRELLPARRADIEALIRKAKARPDWPDLRRRVDYCCKAVLGIDPSAPCTYATLRRHGVGSTYYFDVKQWLRGFDPELRFHFEPGDVTWVPDAPALTKSRPIEGNNANSVLLRLDQVRHFIFVHDKIPYSAKMSKAVFRGNMPGKEKRRAFLERWYGDPMFDLGDTERPGFPQWEAPRMSMQEQMRYKWILALEGNDVASNLKWVMSSNSVAVMPRPEYETWFMEGMLQSDVHYFEIGRDYEDARERLLWLDAHPATADRIVRAAHDRVAEFADMRRERLLATLVLAKYFGYNLD